MYINIIRLLSSVQPLSVLLLAACSGGGSGTSSSAPSTPPAVTYSVGGTLTGLTTGNSIILTNNGSDNLALSASGVSQTFTFATKLADASTYNLTLSAPSPQLVPVTQLLYCLMAKYWLAEGITQHPILSTRSYFTNPTKVFISNHQGANNEH